MLSLVINNVNAFIGDKWPLIALIVAGLYLAFYIGTKWNGFQKDCEAHKKKCRNNEAGIAQILKSSRSIENKIALISGKFNSLIASLSSSEHIPNAGLFEIKSPVKLTSKGYELVKEIGWSKALADKANKKEIFARLDKQDLNNKYDIEKACIAMIFELMGERSENPFLPVKNHLYEHADVDNMSAIRVCGIYLRDEYLKYRKDIS